MKQIYCFLILIIFVFILYDIKLIEGNDHEYDTTQDSNVAYQQSRGTEDSFFDKLGITNLLPKEYSDTISISNTDNLDCSDYRGKAGKMCSDGISARMSGGDWEYGNKNPSNTNKQNCMKCLKCGDNYAFTDSFYSYMCDTMAACFDHPDDYLTESLPYAYAYTHTRFQDECGPNNNQLQKATCAALEGNSVLDGALLFKKPDMMACSAEIATLDSPVGGFVSAIL